jgi:protein SCO1/2
MWAWKVQQLRNRQAAFQIVSEKFVGNKEDQAESLNHSGMLALVDKKGNVRCRFGKNGLPILYYSGLNYEDEQGTKLKLNGKYHPDRKILIEDIKKLLEE